MLVGAAMAFHTVFIVTDSLVEVFAPDICRSMLMASVTGVLLEVALRMAGCACRVMVPVKHEVAVARRRLFPISLQVA